MMASKVEKEFEHAPLAKLDYGFDWTLWLENTETISASSWEVPVDLIKSNEQNLAGVTSVFVEGGIVSKRYEIINSITTSVGRKDSRTITLFCKQR
jgi:hypothetical protein